MVKRKSESLEEDEDETHEGNARNRRSRLEEHKVKALEDYFVNVDIYPTTEKKVGEGQRSLDLVTFHSFRRNWLCNWT